MIDETLTTLSLPYFDGTNRTVSVFVPEHDEGETFPVIYMTDGQNLFEDDKVQFGCWYTREAVRAERKSTGRGAVIVGIFNDGTPKQRLEELLPKAVGELDFPKEMPEEVRRSCIPKGELFDKFVLETVMPAVEAQFPVRKGRENTAFCGSSSGGLETIFAVLEHPDVYSAGGVLSPALTPPYKRDGVEKWLRQRAEACVGNAPYLYIYSGGADPLELEIKTGAEWATDILKECYPVEKVETVIIPDNHHCEKAWEPQFKKFLHIFLQS